MAIVKPKINWIISTNFNSLKEKTNERTSRYKK